MELLGIQSILYEMRETEMKKYRVAQVGCGNRGKYHIKGFMENADRFEVVGLCDLCGFIL